MAAMQRQIVISLADLRYVSLECDHCHSILTLDMAKVSEHQEKYGVFFPRVCSVCQKAFDTATENLDSFRRCYRSLLPIAGRITFRGELESAEPSVSASGRASSESD